MSADHRGPVGVWGYTRAYRGSLGAAEIQALHGVRGTVCEHLQRRSYVSCERRVWLNERSASPSRIGSIELLSIFREVSVTTGHKKTVYFK